MPQSQIKTMLVEGGSLVLLCALFIVIMMMNGEDVTVQGVLNSLGYGAEMIRARKREKVDV